MISITFPFAPVAKGRPRLGRGRVYTPAKTKQFENAITRFARNHYGAKPPLNGALGVSVTFILKPPIRNARKYPVTRPDIDNYAKAVLDALNLIFWHDDGQISQLHASKVYDMTGAGPRIEMNVFEMEDQ